MVEVKPYARESWFDPVGGRRVALEFADRLVDRCHGEEGVMLTLTYRRAEYQDARDLFRASSEERHVRRFIEDLGHVIWHMMPADERPYTPAGNPANPLTGLWCCKLEFQRGGWVHWHLVILGRSFLPHRLVQDVWGHGHVWLTRMTPSTLRYVAKYVAKDSALPGWLYLEPVRSVKIVRASPGFWHDTEPQEWSDAEPRQKLPAHVMIGTMIEAGKHRCVMRDGEGSYTTLKVGAGVVLMALARMGVELQEGEHGWVRCLVAREAVMTGAWTDARAAGGRPPPPLHLTRSGNPPPEVVPPWVVHSLMDVLVLNDPPDPADYPPLDMECA